MHICSVFFTDVAGARSLPLHTHHHSSNLYPCRFHTELRSVKTQVRQLVLMCCKLMSGKNSFPQPQKSMFPHQNPAEKLAFLANTAKGMKYVSTLEFQGFLSPPPEPFHLSVTKSSPFYRANTTLENQWFVPKHTLISAFEQMRVRK